jgi:hypothetical protein
MKRVLMSIALLAAATTLAAQMQPAHKKPLSPPAKAVATMDGHTISIAYSSPRLRGRQGHIFNKGGLISHDAHYPVWRAGANAATTLKTDADLRIGNLTVPKGEYTLFVDVANPSQWTLIVSRDTGEWGLSYDPTKDLGRTAMHMSMPAHLVEDLKWSMTKTGVNKGKLTLAWEYHSASVPFEVK